LINNRQQQQNRGRGRGRTRSPQGNGGRNEGGSRIDNRARGNAPQMLEKYKNMARDAQLQGDRVMTEYYLQFADHYFRIVAESRARFEEQRRQRDDWQGDEDSEESDGENRNNTSDDISENASEIDDDPRYREPRQNQAREYQPRENQQRDNQQRDNQPRENQQRDNRGRDNQQRDNRDSRPQREPRQDARQEGRSDNRNEPRSEPRYDNRSDGRTETQQSEPRRERAPRRTPTRTANGNRIDEEDNALAMLDVSVLPPAFASDGPGPVIDMEEAAPAPRRRGRPRKVDGAEAGSEVA
jgi:hypothetical protein